MEKKKNGGIWALHELVQCLMGSMYEMQQQQKVLRYRTCDSDLSLLLGGIGEYINIVKLKNLVNKEKCTPRFRLLLLYLTTSTLFDNGRASSELSRYPCHINRTIRSLRPMHLDHTGTSKKEKDN